MRRLQHFPNSMASFHINAPQDELQNALMNCPICGRMLVIAQVILALQLPFTLIPLIKATSERKLMGQHKNHFFIQILSWGATALIFLASLFLCISMLLPSEECIGGNHIISGMLATRTRTVILPVVVESSRF